MASLPSLSALFSAAALDGVGDSRPLRAMLPGDSCQVMASHSGPIRTQPGAVRSHYGTIRSYYGAIRSHYGTRHSNKRRLCRRALDCLRLLLVFRLHQVPSGQTDEDVFQGAVRE